HWNPSPLPLLDDFGIGLLYQGTEPAEHLAPPVAQLLDSRVYQPGRRLALLRAAVLHGSVSISWYTATLSGLACRSRFRSPSADLGSDLEATILRNRMSSGVTAS